MEVLICKSLSTFFLYTFLITYQTFLLFRRHLDFNPKQAAQRFSEATTSTATSTAISSHCISSQIISSHHPITDYLFFLCPQAEGFLFPADAHQAVLASAKQLHPFIHGHYTRPIWNPRSRTNQSKLLGSWHAIH